MEINGKTKQPPKMNKNYKNMFEFLQSHKYDKNLHLNAIRALTPKIADP